MIITNAKIYTMETDTPIENGYVRFNRTIQEIGLMKNLKPTNEKVFDAAGKYVFPGFVDAHTHLGMFEDSMGFEGDDGNEESDPITPHLRAIDAINPNDRYFTEAKLAGITTVASGPGSANPISGQFCALKTHGTVIDDMIIKNPVAMKFSFGENPKTVYHGKNQQPVTRMATAALIRETLRKAQEYAENIKLAKENPDDYDKPDYDAKLESLLPVLSGELAVKAHAHRADDIATALRIAEEFGLKMTIEHATEGHLIPQKLQNVSCQLGPTLSDRSKPELRNMTFDTYRILSEQGTPVSIITDHPVIPINYLPLCAALAVKSGMNEIDALKAITLNPAKALGIDQTVGSLKVGKDADIVIFDKFPLELMTKVEAVFINGERI